MLTTARIPKAQIDKRRSKITGLEGYSLQGDEQRVSRVRRA